MKLELGQINRTAVILLLVLVGGIAGFVWWQFLYSPAKEQHQAAQSTAASAQAELASARGRLSAAQQQVDEAKKREGGKLDDSIARLQLATQAITPKPYIDDAAVVLTQFADRSGISTKIDLKSSTDSTDAASGSSATPVTINIKAAGTFAQMQHFISLVEGSVVVKRGQMHVRGRLFNVVSMKMSRPELGSEDGGDGGLADAAKLKVGPNDIMFDLEVRMYTSKFGGSSSSANTTPGISDSAAGQTGATPGVDPTTGGAAAPNAATPGATGAQTDAAGAMSSSPAGGAAGTPGAPGGAGAPAVATAPSGNASSAPGANGAAAPAPGTGTTPMVGAAG